MTFTEIKPYYHICIQLYATTIFYSQFRVTLTRDGIDIHALALDVVNLVVAAAKESLEIQKAKTKGILKLEFQSDKIEKICLFSYCYRMVL